MREAEEQVTEMRRTLQNLMSLRNSFININALPNELLYKIFRTAGEGDMVTGTPLAIKQTCVRWRRVAEGTPVIWTELALPNVLARYPCSVDHFVSLSKSAPLSLELSTHLLSVVKCLRSEDVLNRIQHLDLHLSFGTLDSTHISWTVTAVTPALQSLVLRVDARDSECDVVPPMFQRSVNLRVLRLEGCRFPWAEHMYASGIQELSISSGTDSGYSHAQPYAYLPGDDLGFLGVLRGFNSLQRLHLDRLYGLCKSMDDDRIALQDLRCLSLQLPASTAKHLLDMIVVPPQASLRLSYHTSSTMGAGRDPDVSAYLGQLRSVAFYKTHLLGRYDSREILNESDAHVFIQHCDTRWNRAQLPEGLLASVVRDKFCQAENVVISDAVDALDNPDWTTRLLLACPYVRKLQLGRHCRVSLWRELSSSGDTYNFPHLRDLVIAGCEIGVEEFSSFLQLWTPLKALHTVTMRDCCFDSLRGDVDIRALACDQLSCIRVHLEGCRTRFVENID